MIYIINDQIAFNSDDCSLSHTPTQETLSLSISAGRLFERLLNSQGGVLARETLLSEVWDKYGLRGSNSNLNQYLSILRRTLAAYGCDNLIITIPKIGIRLNTDINVVSVPATVGETSDMAEVSSGKYVADPLPDNLLKPVVIASQYEAPFRIGRRGIVAAAVLLLTIAMFIYYTLVHSGLDNNEFSTIKLEGGCEAVLFSGLEVVESETINRQIQQILKKHNQSCKPGRRIFFDMNTASLPNNFDRAILSACNLDNTGHIISCNNFYYLDWRVK